MFQVCNIKPCGYDVGDCGTANYDKLIGYSLEKKDSHYDVPKGIIFLSLCWDGCVLLKHRKVKEYSSPPLIRPTRLQK